jgi:hypothetical protein
VKELGELIDDGEAALLVVGASTLEKGARQGGTEAGKAVRRSSADVDAAVKDAAGRIG